MLNKIKKALVCLIVLGMACGFLMSCDAGDKVIDQATGKETLDQYKATKDKLNAIDEKQKERYRDMLDEESRENR